jgi:RHS repeat-associated protein
MSPLRVVALALLVASSTFNGLAQNPQPGLPVDSAQIPIPLGSINPLTENVHLEIPIASIQQRGDNPLVAKFAHDTQLFVLGPGGYASGWTFIIYPEKYTTVAFSTTSGPCPDPAYPNGHTNTNSNFYASDSHNTRHYANPSLQTYQIVCTDNNGNPDPNTGQPSAGSATDQDGLGYVFTVNNYTNAFVTDVDGNVGYLDTNGNHGGTVPDMLGRSAVSAPGNVFQNCAGNNTGPFQFNVKASDGSTGTYTEYCQNYSVSEIGYSPQIRTLTSRIVLPDGTQYSFNYDTGTSGDHFGALTSVTLPTGGQETFTYSCYDYPTQYCDLTSATFESGTWNFSYVKGLPVGTIDSATVTWPARYDSASQKYVTDTTVYTSQGSAGPGRVQSIQRYSGSSTLLKTVSWTYKPTLGSLVDVITTTLNDTGQSSKIQYQYFSNISSRPSQIQEWDFGSSTPTRTTKMSYGVLNRLTGTSVWSGDGTSGTPLSQTTYTYDEYSANYCKNGVPMLTNVTGAINHDDTNYGLNYTTRGNVTSVSRWVSGTTWVTSHKCYDTLGNVTQEVDEAGNPTNYDYTEPWTDTSCIPAGTITRAFPKTSTDPMGLRTQTTRYSCTNLAQAVAGENDIANSRAGTTYTHDWANRALCTNDAGGGQTCNSYFDTATPPYSTQTTAIATGVTKSTQAIVDGYGRVTQTQLTSDPAGSIDYTDTTYDALGHRASVSNPYRSTSDPTYGVTNYYYDALGRPTSVVEPDSSSVSTTYSGNTATSIDEAGDKRKSQSDAFGRLTAVWEDPSNLNYETDYFYDALGNRICVQQKGGVTTPAGTGCAYSASGDKTSPWRIRRFSYDGLSRLINSSTPEGGAVGYAYNANSTLQARTAPAPNQTGTATITTNYSYDADGRLTQKSYPGTTFPAVTFWYDGVAPTGCTPTPPPLTDSNPKGNRTAMCDGSGATTWTHDPVDRVLMEKRKIGTSAGQSTTYAYNADGSLYRITNPLGQTITYTPGGAGLPLAAKNGGSNNYVKNATYAPFGGLTGMVNGYTSGFAGISVSNSYNKRLQPSVLSASTSLATVFSLSYGYGAANRNNGNISQIVNNLNNARNQSFAYDSLNRISTAASQATSGPYCWGQVFGYYSGSNLISGIDAWGNLNQITPSQCSSYGLTQTSNYQNQISGFCYDAAGNLLDETGCAGSNHTFVYDPEGDLLYTSGEDYIYDGDGRRVIKCASTNQSNTCPAGSTGTLYWRNTEGNTIVESDLAATFQNEYIYFNGLRVARRDASSSVHYYFADHLTSARVVTNATGTTPPEQDVDFTPYGIVADGTPTEHYLFTGQERDSESTLDYFNARHYTSALGRFMVPDPSGTLSANSANPQSWNQYTYVLNNPIVFADSTGLRCLAPGTFVRGDDGNGNQAWLIVGSCEDLSNGCTSQMIGFATTVDCTVPDHTPSYAYIAGMAGGVWNGPFGHHPLSGWSVIQKGTDAYKFFRMWNTGKLPDPSVNYYDWLHRMYNEEVNEIVKKFLESKDKSELGELSKEECKQLARQILNSESPGISKFLTRLDASYTGATAALAALIDGTEVMVVMPIGTKSQFSGTTCDGADCQGNNP